MRAYRSGKWAARGALASIIMVALAGCGGGGGGDSTVATPSPTPPPTNPTPPPTNPTPPPTTVTVASVKFPATSGIAIVGTAKTIPVTVIGSDDKVMTGKTVAWQSSSDATATVDAAGVVNPQAAGNATITATVDGVQAMLNLTVSDAPADLAAFKSLFPNPALGTGGFKVASDVSQAYSVVQRDHLLDSWNFFAGFFPMTPGTHTEMYYTWDKSLLDYANASFGGICRTVAPLPGRYVLTCSEGSINSWVVSPILAANGDVPPEYATALSSLSQSFMDKIAAVETYRWPWLWEGLSVAFKYGDFSGPGGIYAMQTLGDPDLSKFRAIAPADLLPLTDPITQDLVELTRTRLDPLDPQYVQNTWSLKAATASPQAAMLMNYVFRQPAGTGTLGGQATLKSLFAEIGTTVTTSEAALAYVVSGLGLASADDLDSAYKAYGAGL